MRVALVVVIAFVAGGCCSADVDDLFELPANPIPERGAQGAGPFDDDATCASGDGCSDCPLLDSDCDDGVTCIGDGLCTSACFEPDPDCARLDDGSACTFGEECVSLRCVALDGDGTCARACDDGACNDGFACVDELCAPLICG